MSSTAVNLLHDLQDSPRRPAGSNGAGAGSASADRVDRRLVERRAERRLGVNALVNLHLPGAGRFELPEVRAARLINVSLGGAQIACNQLPGIIGDRVQIDLPGLFGDPITLAASVMGIQARDDGVWVVSLRFVPPVGANRAHLQRIMDMLSIH